jgi:hypothetical protein
MAGQTERQTDKQTYFQNSTHSTNTYTTNTIPAYIYNCEFNFGVERFLLLSHNRKNIPSVEVLPVRCLVYIMFKVQVKTFETLMHTKWIKVSD